MSTAAAERGGRADSLPRISPLFKELAVVLVIKVALIAGLWALFFSNPAPMTDRLVGERLIGASVHSIVAPAPTINEGNER